MNCRSATEKLSAYLDGELDATTSSAVRGHLRLCDTCRLAAEDHAAIRDRLAELARPEPPPAVWEGVLARLGEAEIADARRSRWSLIFERIRPHLVPAGLATAACAGAVLFMHLRDDGDRARPAAVARDEAVTPPVAPPDHDQVAVPAPVPRPPVTRDATAELADEAARIDARFRTTTAELLPLARAELQGAARARFNREVAALEAKVVRAAAGAARDRAWHDLLGFLERAALGERLAMSEVRR